MSRADVVGKPDVIQRETAIISYLRDHNGATVREIYEDVSQALGDTISRPAYYKLLDRLTVAGKIDQIDEDGVRRYILLPQIHATNRLTLDDVYEMLPFVDNTEAMARAIEAQEYFYRNRTTVLKDAALALQQENAAQLFFRWIDHLVAQLEADLESFNSVEEEGAHVGQTVLADAALEARLRAQCEGLREILYRYLSIPRNVVDIPLWEGNGGLKRTGRIYYNSGRLSQELQKRVIGVGNEGSFIGRVQIGTDSVASAQEEMIISGSDGSFHAGTMGIRTSQGYIEDESFIVTFNNSVAYVRSSDKLARQRGSKKFLHSAPVTRQVLNDPTYKGMVLAPFMFPMLTESEYEHMTRTASDVVQMRVDDALFSGNATDMATGEQILPPRIHIRDGTITPQERGFNHYILMNPYGEIAREGIRLSRNILRSIVTARRTPQLYVGCVKSTQLKLFSRLLNWYISYGSRTLLGKPLAANWDIERAGLISDIDVMTLLLSNDAVPPAPNGFWMSCVVIRQFASLTDFYDRRVANGDWLGYLSELRNNALQTHDKFGGELPYHALISEDDLAELPYLYMLEHADYAAFYIGHTHGEPPPKIPRYEFMCSYRENSADEIAASVNRIVEQIATALITCEFAQDRDHNFMSRLSLVKLIPSVVHHAHEFAKQLGKKLESEFKSIVVARLAAKRKQQLDEKDVEILPVGTKQYVNRFSQARNVLSQKDLDTYER
jgi:Fe2+ or Zn2+ uptake regulation protein